jgi:TrpR-related protein YerC/YecD
MDWKEEKNKRLVEAVLALETEKEAKCFLRDLMTSGEIEEFANRLKAAEMLLEKDPYSAIEKETGLSSATVARVSKWLNGKEKGYKIIIARLHHRKPARSKRGLV